MINGPAGGGSVKNTEESSEQFSCLGSLEVICLECIEFVFHACKFAILRAGVELVHIVCRK